MPVELKELACEITQLLNMGDYRPEALIINYYGSKNVMGGHLDDGEPDQEHPIVSFSFGLSCVFLIGGRTKETEPIAIRLDPGDVMVMSQESRKCVHGVPRIIETSQHLLSTPEFVEAALKLESEVKPEEVQAVRELMKINPEETVFEVNTYAQTLTYLKENRINMNFRQVDF